VVILFLSVTWECPPVQPLSRATSKGSAGINEIDLENPNAFSKTKINPERNSYLVKYEIGVSTVTIDLVIVFTNVFMGSKRLPSYFVTCRH